MNFSSNSTKLVGDDHGVPSDLKGTLMKIPCLSNHSLYSVMEYSQTYNAKFTVLVLWRLKGQDLYPLSACVLLPISFCYKDNQIASQVILTLDTGWKITSNFFSFAKPGGGVVFQCPQILVSVVNFRSI